MPFIGDSLTSSAVRDAQPRLLLNAICTLSRPKKTQYSYIHSSMARNLYSGSLCLAAGRQFLGPHVDFLIVDVDIVASHIAWQRLNLRPCVVIITTARINEWNVLANALLQH